MLRDNRGERKGIGQALLRAGLIVYSCVLFIFAAGFVFDEWWATDLWPFSYSAGMSFIFVSSILAAAGTSILYCGLARDYRAMVGVGIDALVITLPIAILAFSSERKSMRTFAILSSVTAVAGLLAAIWFHRYEFRDHRPTPMLVRISFVIFVVALWVFGGMLTTGSQRILPWGVSPEVAKVYGWIFIGASSYFLYGLIIRKWSNAAGQLLGFLAYDLVLIVPFIRFFRTVGDDKLLNHIVYTSVVVYSALLAIYCCFIHPATRLTRITLK